MMVEARRVLANRLRADLIGPSEPGVSPNGDPLGPDEVLRVRPTDRYVTGILFPRQLPPDQEQNDELGLEGDDDDSTVGKQEAVALGNIQRPNSIGLSFAARSLSGVPAIRITIRCGTYTLRDENGDPAGMTKKLSARQERWHRMPQTTTVTRELVEGTHSFPSKIDGLEIWIKVTRWKEAFLVTVAITNARIGDRDKVSTCLTSFFQSELIIQPEPGTELIARPSRRSFDADDLDERTNALIYRDAREYAVGHTCSATWELSEGRVASLATSWTPEVVVKGMSTDGDHVFDALRAAGPRQPLSAKWLATASPDELVAALAMLPDAYNKWLEAQEAGISSLSSNDADTARQHIRICRDGAARMRGSIECIRNDTMIRQAFQLANMAILIQRQWLDGTDLRWRPFQLGFQLLSLESLAMRGHEDRNVVDLLWFPTGGGKTEAYLGLTAFIAFLRRLRGSKSDGGGAGVAVLMRYTLRLLTIQQFERASRLICACERIRLGNDRPEGTETLDLGTEPFSIGLWVGGDATPNTVVEAEGNLRNNKEPTPKQITKCPACKGELHWYAAQKPKKAIHCECRNAACPAGSPNKRLPIHTVDEDIYNVRPTLVIGTIDKFAQIARSPERTGALFAVDGPHAPPDLIIQDELHLISGPLGTIAALYEIAIDQLCATIARPKVIGSTATIRRAHAQIEQLFDRRAYQFPPPVLDANNSCFARIDSEAPGRLYVGLTTAGRSAKLMLGAIAASLLQSATSPNLDDAHRNYYWTLVSYFNTIRELGGAVVLMQDDVTANIPEYAYRRNESPRKIAPPEELTSRRSSAEIPKILANLERTPGHEDAYDIMLASNMISVGVDVPRLGLMIVHGQPKGIAEYIQATSRVGRGNVPGLVVTLYNNGKARDRSHFETFRTWHETLYRDVEATSVTPFAPRARERALHAALVALVRARIPGLRNSPKLTAPLRKEVEKIAESIARRAEHIDPEEHPSVRALLIELLDHWQERCGAGLKDYWDDEPADAVTTLMMSAEEVATYQAVRGIGPNVWATMNSMRGVEPSTQFILLDRLRDNSTT